MGKIAAVVIAAYLLGMLIVYLFGKSKSKKKGLVAKQKRELKTEQILGKSYFKVCHSKPQVRSYPKDEKADNKEHIFAPESQNEQGSQAETAGLTEEDYYPITEKMDFGKPSSEQINLGEEEDDSMRAERAKTEVIGGVKLEAILEALDNIERTDTSPQEQQRAGDTLAALEGSNIAEELRSNPQRAMRMDELINARLKSQPFMRLDGESSTAPTAQTDKPMFDIRDYL